MWRQRFTPEQISAADQNHILAGLRLRRAPPPGQPKYGAGGSFRLTMASDHRLQAGQCMVTTARYLEMNGAGVAEGRRFEYGRLTGDEACNHRGVFLLLERAIR